jgi:C1A family cysteine protease
MSIIKEIDNVFDDIKIDAEAFVNTIKRHYISTQFGQKKENITTVKNLPSLSSLPPKKDLRENDANKGEHVLPPVYNQGNVGSCTGNALGGAVEYDDNGFHPSRLFIYYNERYLEGTVRQDSGAYLIDGIKSLEKYGVCSENTWPYIESRFAQKPSPVAYTEALKHKIIVNSVVSSDNPETEISTVNLNLIKQHLAAGYPCAFIFIVYDSFESLQAPWILDLPQPEEQVQGGHAILCVGYDDNKEYETRNGTKKGCFIIRNSWGAEWGENGYFYMTYDFIQGKGNDGSSLTSEMYCIESISN